MAKQKTPESPRPKTKRRRHGYRGYGSPIQEDRGGAVHWGRGFTGVGFPGETGGVLPTTIEVLPEELRPKSSRKDSSKKKK